MRPLEISPVIRGARNIALAWLLLNAIDPHGVEQASVDATQETPAIGEECPPGQHVVYMRPPHPGSSTRAVSQHSSTLWGRAEILERRIAHPDPRASTTLHDFVDVFIPDQEVCK